MSEGIVYADVKFKKHQQTEGKDGATASTVNDATYSEISIPKAGRNQTSTDTNAGDPDSQEGSKVRAGGCDPVKVVLVTLCFLLMGMVIGLRFLSGDPDSQEGSKVRAGGCDPVKVVLVTLCFLLMGMVIGLRFLSGDPDSQKGSKVKPGGYDPVKVVLVTLCVLLMGTVIGLVFLYISNLPTKNTELQILQAAYNRNLTDLEKAFTSALMIKTESFKNCKSRTKIFRRRNVQFGNKMKN
nr:uncharacterized protein LOC115128326 isoform X3 [Oncorhynchus nerka]